MTEYKRHIIPHLEHEMQIDHTNHAVDKFVNGDVDYITGSAPVEIERVNFFFVFRVKEDPTKYAIEVNNEIVDEYHAEGMISYAEIKIHVLNIIDNFQAKHGPRSHEDMPRCILYVGGKYI